MDNKGNIIARDPPLFKCRICKVHSAGGQKFCVFKIMHKIRDTLGIEVETMDAEPNLVCVGCQCMIVNFYEFKQRVLRQNEFIIGCFEGNHSSQYNNQESCNSWPLVEKKTVQCQTSPEHLYFSRGCGSITPSSMCSVPDNEFVTNIGPIADAMSSKREVKLELKMRKSPEYGTMAVEDSDKENVKLIGEIEPKLSQMLQTTHWKHVCNCSSSVVNEKIQRVYSDDDDDDDSESTNSDMFYEEHEDPLIIAEKSRVKSGRAFQTLSSRYYDCLKAPNSYNVYSVPSRSSVKNCKIGQMGKRKQKFPVRSARTIRRRRKTHDTSSGCKMCYNCGIDYTTIWRRDRRGNVVCNACGLYYKLKKCDRPVSMRKAEIHKRNRRPVTAKISKGNKILSYQMDDDYKPMQRSMSANQRKARKETQKDYIYETDGLEDEEDE